MNKLFGSLSKLCSPEGLSYADRPWIHYVTIFWVTTSLIWNAYSFVCVCNLRKKVCDEEQWNTTMGHIRASKGKNTGDVYRPYTKVRYMLWFFPFVNELIKLLANVLKLFWMSSDGNCFLSFFPKLVSVLGGIVSRRITGKPGILLLQFVTPLLS